MDVEIILEGRRFLLERGDRISIDDVVDIDFESAEDMLRFAANTYKDHFNEDFPRSYVDPDGAVALARSMNLLAKKTAGYFPKTVAFAGAAMLDGVKSGWKRDHYGDWCFFIIGPINDQASAHDPFDKLYSFIDEHAPHLNKRFSGKWDKRNVQPYAREIAYGLVKKRDRLLRKRFGDTVSVS